MKDFEYSSPKSLEEATALLYKYGEKARVMAGGTDLLPQMKKLEMKPELIIDLKDILNLTSIDYIDGKGLRIGALVKIRNMETSGIIKEKFGVLSQAAGTLGSVQVRNKATVGGNLCHAAPSADMAPALIGLDATVKVVGQDGDKSLPLEEFFRAPGKTALQAGEILIEISIPDMAKFSEGVYVKFSPRTAMDLAVVGVASILTMDGVGDDCQDIRIVLGAVAPTPMRARKAEAIMRGNKITVPLIEEAARVAAEEAEPISDIRASASYRREIVKVLVNRTINQALKKIN